MKLIHSVCISKASEDAWSDKDKSYGLCDHSSFSHSDLVSSFRWVKDGELFQEEMNGSGALTAEQSEELKFYEGKYRCYAANELGTAVSGLIELTTEREFKTLL